MCNVDFVRSTILVSAIFARSLRRAPTVVRSSTLAARVALTLGGWAVGTMLDEEDPPARCVPRTSALVVSARDTFGGVPRRTSP